MNSRFKYSGVCCNERMLQRTNATTNECCNERKLQRTNATTNECYNERGGILLDDVARGCT